MIPDDAKKVFQGEVFGVYQWEQELYDGSKAIFEGLKRADTAAVLATTDNKILLMEQEQPHRKKSFICLPGGRVDEGENVLEAAKRELLEETGYASDDWQLYRKWRPSGKVDWNIHVYLAKGCKKAKDQNLDPGERIKVTELSFDEFLDQVDKEDFRHYEIKVDFVRAKYDEASRKELKDKLFAN